MGFNYWVRITLDDLRIRLLKSVEKMLMMAKSKDEVIRELKRLKRELEKKDPEIVIMEFEEKIRKTRAAQ